MIDITPTFIGDLEHMRTLILTIALVTISLSRGAETRTAQVKNKFPEDVAKFATEPVPAPGGILLVGSSIFRKWLTFASDLAPLPATNRAFGGSQTKDQLLFFDQIVPTSHARLVVWYCGSNDINNHKKPDFILKNTQDWINRTRAALPHARIVLISVIRAPQKREDGYLVLVDEVNKGLRSLATDSTDLTYVDVNPVLEDSAGESLVECYGKDKLHFTPEGYRRLTSVLHPALEKNWKQP
ncbi:MAG: GDSL-type esterase/lipase family protein [Akkermansiaceae bacterium]|nr:GDSL-type esterase/lipase family protein [Akkermansiaceae bacterium]